MPASANLAKKLAQYDANKKSSADILNESMAQYGIPEIRGRVSGLRTTLSNTESALNNVDPSVTGRTSRSLVTEAQRQAIVNKERQPIAQQYGDQSKALTTESANLNDQERAAELLAQGMTNDYTTGRNALQSRYDSAVSREAEKRRQKEANRSYSLEKNRAKQARIDADRNYQLALKQANKPSGGGGGRASDNDKPPALNNGLSQLFRGYKPAYKGGKAYYTEDVIIPQIMDAYGLSEKAAKNKVYAYRKKTFGEGYGS